MLELGMCVFAARGGLRRWCGRRDERWVFGVLGVGCPVAPAPVEFIDLIRERGPPPISRQGFNACVYSRPGPPMPTQKCGCLSGGRLEIEAPLMCHVSILYARGVAT